MSFLNFWSKPDPKEEQKETDRALRKVGRDLERDRLKLEREEKKLEQEIKKLAKEGDKEGCTILAKQLVQLRKQKTRSYAASSKVTGVQFQNKAMGANVKLAESMGIAGKTMSNMNKMMRPEQISATVNAFSRENMKMEMTDEMINDTLDEMLTESGDEEESDNIVSQVLDEIGIEISGKMSGAPLPETGKLGAKSKGLTDEEIEAQLANLRS
ncbi:charged multivesicular body protein 2b-B [Sitophilus oryzae]|uniref:Charged multivesicular body protein 2b-B n=1 Tax=Sitophilus oryzae TaxID=7048 RepID=A0A6J2YI89_SITOR|nr:charged multivesicular body protein 2b-B [Sitophilus oryzae]